MPVDLHAHSTASDGTASPTKLVDLAVQCGLSALALTDHDTQQGVAEAREASDGTPVDLIAGTELSLDHEQGGMHLVVLWLEPGPGPLQDRLQDLQAGRNDRNQKIVEILTDNGMPMTINEVAEEAGAGTVGRPHIAAVMKRKGYVTEISQAFDEWLGSGKIAYVERRRLDPEEGIGLARESGAVPVLAHPHTLGISTAAAMADILTRLRGAGLIGLEANYSSYRRHEREGYADLARRFDLVPSGGSDYHGSYKPGLDLGVGYGDLAVPEKTLQELQRHARTP